MSKLIPTRDRVIVKRDKADEKSKGGILLPETMQKNPPQRGKVVAVGEPKTVDGAEQKFAASPGDTVYFAPYVGSEVKVDDEEFIVLRYDDVIAVLK